MSKTLIVKNCKPTLVRLGGSGVMKLSPQDSPDAAKKHLAGGLVLFPGNNKVDADDWKKAMEMATTKHMLDEGLLELVGDGKVSSPAGQPQPQALKLVRETFKKELLEEWAAEESRGPVKHAIKEQLAKLKLPEKKPGEGEGDKPGAA